MQATTSNNFTNQSTRKVIAGIANTTIIITISRIIAVVITITVIVLYNGGFLPPSPFCWCGFSHQLIYAVFTFFMLPRQVIYPLTWFCSSLVSALRSSMNSIASLVSVCNLTSCVFTSDIGFASFLKCGLCNVFCSLRSHYMSRCLHCQRYFSFFVDNAHKSYYIIIRRCKNERAN